MKDTVCIMQPKLFGWIGYFQLFEVGEKFVIYDDVNFPKKSWMNRNRILFNKKEHYFTFPINKVSQNKLIKELYFVEENSWKKSFLKTIKYAYAKAPFFDEIYKMIEKIMAFESFHFVSFLENSFRVILEYLGIKTELIRSSEIKKEYIPDKQERIIHICKIMGAKNYVNAIGGMELYDKETFKKNGINLYFIKTKEIKYKQFGEDFIPNLSIIDVLMFNGKETSKYLKKYELI